MQNLKINEDTKRARVQQSTTEQKTQSKYMLMCRRALSSLKKMIRAKPREDNIIG